MKNHTCTQTPSNTRSTRNGKRRRGQGMVEYIIIVALLAVGMIGAVTSFRKVVNTTYTNATTRIEGVTKLMGANDAKAD